MFSARTTSWVPGTAVPSRLTICEAVRAYPAARALLMISVPPKQNHPSKIGSPPSLCQASREAVQDFDTRSQTAASFLHYDSARLDVERPAPAADATRTHGRDLALCDSG